MLEIETTLRKNVESRFQNGRALSHKIQILESRVGTILTSQEISESGKQYMEELEMKALQDIGFKMTDKSSINKHQVYLELEQVSLDDALNHLFINVDEDREIVWKKVKQIRKDLTDKFDFIEPLHDEYYIGYTEQNLSLLSTWVEVTFQTQIEGYKVCKKNNMEYIESFHFSFTNIL